MLLQDQLSSEPAVPDFERSCIILPDVARVDAIDRQLRIQLQSSFRHISDCLGLSEDGHASLEMLERRLQGCISPWVFCLYSKLVAELSSDEGDTALLDDVVSAASRPAAEGVVALRDPSVSPTWWNQFEVLFDTDGDRNFKPKIANPDSFVLCKREVESGLALLHLADPQWHAEVRALVRMVVLGSSPLDAEDTFNGASTFFFWGGSLINAELRRSPVSIIDLLVHEGSHLLLFGLSAEGPLLNNGGEERYSSPLRADPRPIDGVLHATFVATRVHLAMGRLLESGTLTEENVRRASERKTLSATTALIGLGVLDEHARPTDRGEILLATLRSYWAAA